ncbi:MAG: hypothetical protein PHG05_00345 [Candidatus Nanoarchaeia archaeon]|nr:hypothetical protein [Candidatus Nanoarchaeia archaeon]
MYILETLPGLEEPLINEVKGKQLFNGLVESQTKKSLIAYKISKLLAKIKFKDQNDLLYQIDKLELDIEKDFFIKCSNKEMELEIAKALIKKGFNPDPKVKEPIRIYLYDNTALFTLVINQNNEKRDYRFRRYNQSTDSCIADVLLQESGIKENDSLMDPFCKDSIILTEAFNHGIRRLFGFDSSNNIRNSKINIKLAKAEIILEEKKFNQITKKTDFCLTTLPFISKRKPSTKIIEEFFKKIFKLSKKVGIITYNPEITTKIIKLNKLSIEKQFHIVKGSQNISIFIFKPKKLS